MSERSYYKVQYSIYSKDNKSILNKGSIKVKAIKGYQVEDIATPMIVEYENCDEVDVEIFGVEYLYSDYYDDGEK